jgi:hypothetical protein
LADLLIDSLRKTDFDISKTMVSASKWEKTCFSQIVSF